jgi:hypothetical protein
MGAVDKFQDNWGLIFTRPEGGHVVLPEDISEVPSETLGSLMSKLTAWSNYIETQLAIAEDKERQLLRKKGIIEAELLEQYPQVKGERITAIKSKISVHPDVLDADDAYEEAYAYRRLVKVLYDNYERDRSLVSREITRRGEQARKGFGV